MRPFSFVHAADLHIDSPFRGVTADSPAVAEALYSSTFRAFDALIEMTLEREADFLLVAGDVYDGKDRSLRAQLRLRDGLVRLADRGIQSFIVHGNHDPLDSRVTTLEWPKEAHFFGKRLESVSVLGSDGKPMATVSGISFPKKEESRNLAAEFSRTETGLFQIGLLHCNVGGNTGHENYAPCTLDDLRSADMDYWALGHIHTRSVLSESPWVVYPGNIQGRSMREQGARGCYHVRVDEHGGVKADFVPLDVVRWSEIRVSIEGPETMDALERALVEHLEEASAGADGRSLVCRVSLVGRGALHGSLRRDESGEQLLERLRERFSGENPFLWVQRLAIESRPRVDLAERMGRQDLLSEVLATGRE
ncbi:MAG: DNA repair exonuclease, partial [Acidobacteria bacterium]|nr:DNA repair exonuclease [Acidobacteriota bacterium]